MNKTKMLAAQAMVRCLEEEGIDIIFGYPGAVICPFYDSLSQSKIRHILVRQEQNAGHAASGYARETGKPGVCVVTSGPGATNLITAVATAYADSVPMIAITGQVSTKLLGRDVFQEVDITGSVEPFIKHSYLVKDAQEIPRIFKEAFYIASSGRPGPVLIDCPIDVQLTEILFSYDTPVSIRGYKPSIKGHLGQIKKVKEAIEHAKRPLICAGGGVINARACDELLALVEKCEIPVITTMMGIGSISSKHPLYYGMLGTHGMKTANYAIQNSDLLILLGARVSDRAIAVPSMLEKNNTIIHIDVDPAEIGKNVGVKIPVVGDAKAILSQMLEVLPSQKRPDWLHDLNRLRHESFRPFRKRNGTVNPKAFMSLLSQKAPDETTVVADVGQNQIWTANHFQIENGKFITTGGMGTMGYAIPAAIGAKLASEKKEVIAVCGDGAFQMEMMELATLCQHQISIKIVVMKNNRLGMVREYQTVHYADRQMAVALDGSPNFAMLASAYGIESLTIANDAQAENAIDKMLFTSSPFLLEVIVDEKEASLDD